MTLTQMRAKARYLLGELTSTNISDSTLNTALNDYYNRATTIAILSSGNWEVSGEVATTDLIAGQKDYSFPSDLVTIKRIEVNLDGTTNGWQVPTILDSREIPYPLSNTSAFTMDTTMDLYDLGVRFLTAPTSNVTAGLKIWYSDDATTLTGDSDVPNLNVDSHMYLVYGACLDYSIRSDDDGGVLKFQGLLDRSENRLKEYYTNRKPLVKTQFKTLTNTYE